MKLLKFATFFLLLMMGIASGQWLTPTPITTQGPDDTWYFTGYVFMNNLYIGGATGTNGVFIFNGVSISNISDFLGEPLWGSAQSNGFSVGGNIIPSTGNVYNLGSIAYPWGNIYAGSNGISRQIITNDPPVPPVGFYVDYWKWDSTSTNFCTIFDNGVVVTNKTI